MKRYLKYTAYTILVVISLCFLACQAEEPLEVQVNEEQSFAVGSTTAELLMRTVSNDGSHDNIVDGASCIDIAFPYVVTVNGQEITINSDSDFKTIEELFDATDADDDILNIVFPINITKTDYSELTIDSIADLDEITAQCIEGGSDTDIECIDIVYPINLFSFNSTNQEKAALTVTSDQDLSRFFAGIKEAELVSIEYPVLFKMYDDSTLEVYNNSELTAAIEQAKEGCDEDDDLDYNDDDFTIESLDDLLLKCAMELEWNFRESIPQGAYQSYYLDFSEEGIIHAITQHGLPNVGEWSTHWVDNRVLLRLNFNDIPVLNYDWYVNEIHEGKIELFTNDGLVKVILQSNCDYEVLICDDSFIKDSLSNCNWVISESSDQNEFLKELRIDFYDVNMQVSDGEGALVDQGNWEVAETILIFNNLNSEMQSYNGEWEIIECATDTLKVKRGDEYLILEKSCT